MRNCSFLFLFVLMAVAASAAGPETKYKAPRNEYGQPDLQGVWNFSSDVPLERPSAFADKKFLTREELEKQKAAKANALGAVAKLAPVEAVGLTWLDYGAHIEDLRTSLITYPENGRLPKLVEGVRRIPGIDDFIAALNDAKGDIPPALLAGFGGGKKDGHEDLGLAERCMAGGSAPYRPGFDDNYLEVFQTRDHVVLLAEGRDARIIPLDGRPHLGDRLRSWSGDPRAHWEGETLVIETTNFNNRTGSFAGAGRSRDKVVTERVTRTSKNALEYEATIVDPKTFQDKIVLSFPMAKVEARLYESACHEGNYSLPMTLAGARRAEQEAMKTKP
jgi:hypothetical protein